MTQRDGREDNGSTVSNHAGAGRSSMADDNLITRAEPRNREETHDNETKNTQSTGGGDRQA